MDFGLLQAKYGEKEGTKRRRVPDTLELRRYVHTPKTVLYFEHAAPIPPKKIPWTKLHHKPVCCGMDGRRGRA